MSRLLVLVLACGALLISTEAQQDYHTLPALYKEAIKSGVKNAHGKTKSHMNFFGILGDPKISADDIDIEFHLRATNCEKASEPYYQDGCTFRDDRPLINCRVCGKRSGDVLVDPKVDCVPQGKVNEVKDKRQQMCPNSPAPRPHGPGSVSALSGLTSIADGPATWKHEETGRETDLLYDMAEIKI